MAWNWKKRNAAKVVELVLFFVAALAAKLTYRMQHRVPEDADGLIGQGGVR